ncbi:hypothetical protein BO70DRAFT_352506 [Aspergillus heteromorphus CBS 117.55]|uniref:Uncharacterized protein n=1 Tax=Aspergillus heteromorphus CBS 117.55 TaxID=1448321 RepID=A0A317W8D8_9EURO|nr:uncharacterized protein BO70DRAFT_352506 [Aspergillus heteromorphus CBS 117.55]PWY82886.1 hypothetical protein BO70DRAFT_352506 [Aspergillus heteromorphus CBS 117.55]
MTVKINFELPVCCHWNCMMMMMSTDYKKTSPFSSAEELYDDPSPSEYRNRGIEPDRYRSLSGDRDHHYQYQCQLRHSQPFNADCRVFRPVVVPRTRLTEIPPETSKAFKGTFYSPFMRAYSPVLAEAGIPSNDFLAFIDGLNEVFIANPILQTTGMVGGILSMVPFPPVKLAGIGVKVASKLSTAGISYGRTRAYIKDANLALFGPRGLHCTVMSTKDMMTKVGLDEVQQTRVLSSPSSSPEDQDDVNEVDSRRIAEIHDAYGGDAPVSRVMPADPRLQRLNALEGFVAPLQIDGLPDRVAQTNVLKRMNAAFAETQEAKQIKKSGKQRDDSRRTRRGRLEDAERERQQCDMEIATIERKMEILHEKAARESYDGSAKRDKVEKVFDKEMRRLQHEMDKACRGRDRKVDKSMKQGEDEWERVGKRERRIASKIRWVVISKREEGQPDDETPDESE